MKMFFISLFVAAPLLAQTASEKIAIEYIEVPVTVIDRAGQPVRGLTKENFQIFSDKKSASIASFETIDFTKPESLKLAEKNPASRRSFLLLFDLGYSSPLAIKRAQEAARTFIAKSVQPRDLVAVGTIDVKRGYKVLANFSTDRATALAAIDKPLSFRAADPLQLARDTSINMAQNDADEAVADDRGREVYEERRQLGRHEEAGND